MIRKPLSEVTDVDIQDLVDTRAEEDVTLEFKREFPTGKNQDLIELRADVTAMANTSGGDIVFGVREENSIASEVVGIPTETLDKEIRRIEQVLRSCVEPLLPGFELKVIPITSIRSALVLRVPRSWLTPHMVRVNDSYRMYRRSNKGNHLLDASEIKDAFVNSDLLPSRIRKWRDDRISLIAKGKEPLRLREAPKFVLHLVPILPFAKNSEISVSVINRHRGQFEPLFYNNDVNYRINIDGLRSESPAQKDFDGVMRTACYCQVFRTGAIEAVSSLIENTIDGSGTIGNLWLANKLFRSVAAYRDGLLKCDVSLPYLLLATLIDAKGKRLAADMRLGVHSGASIDRNEVRLPEALIETPISEIQADVKPILDGLWNACGWERCMDYSVDGVWDSK